MRTPNPHITQHKQCAQMNSKWNVNQSNEHQWLYVRNAYAVWHSAHTYFTNEVHEICVKFGCPLVFKFTFIDFFYMW